MTTQPQGHVLLRDDFVYATEDRLYLASGQSVDLSAGDAEILACLERGESEFSLLCRRLCTFDSTRDVNGVARALLTNMAQSGCVMEFHEPVDLIEPDVIVSSFSQHGNRSRMRSLVRRLRKRWRVLHVGIGSRVDPVPRQALSPESVRAAGQSFSSFQFFQLVRSLVGFHRRAVLVLEAPVDHALLGDLLADRPGVAMIPADWPPLVELQDLRGADALVRDPRGALRSLFYALRFLNSEDPDSLQARSSTDLAAISLYGLRHASSVQWSRCNQPAVLANLGRRRGLDGPGLILRSRRASAHGERDVLAVLFDLASLQSASQVLGVLVKEFHAFRNVRRLAVRVPEGWCEVRSEPSVLKVVSWPGAPPSVANVACALALPGVMQDPRAWVECMEWGVPVLHYPGGDDSPLQTCVAERARLTVTTTSELIATLDAAADPSSEFHADLVRATRRRLRTQEIAGVVDQLLKMRLADVALA